MDGGRKTAKLEVREVLMKFPFASSAVEKRQLWAGRFSTSLETSGTQWTGVASRPASFALNARS